MDWGILGSGKIAGKFADGLRETEGQTLVAVGSRSTAKADKFSSLHGGESYDSYDALLNDASVEAVYVSLPNSLHHEWTIKALRAGKHVLCEKPIASSEAEAVEMFQAAEQTDRTLVEAFMYRCHPAIQALLATVREGAIGHVKLIRSHFTFHREASAADVRYQADLSGGSIMDVGCYAINFSRAIAGCEPTSAQAVRHNHEFGVDDFAAGMLDFGGETIAIFSCGMTVQADRTTYIGGETGHIRIADPWFTEGSFDVVRPTGVETIKIECATSPYALEAEAFARVVKGESPWITPEDSIGNMRVLDELRR